MPLVDVDDVADAHVADAGEVLVVILSAPAVGPRGMTLVVAADADDRDVDRLVRAALRAASLRERQGQPRRRGRGLGEEHTTIHDSLLRDYRHIDGFDLTKYFL